MTSWLITGGTGSLGQALVRDLLAAPNPPERVVVYSRDEQKQDAMAKALGDDGMGAGSRIRFNLGDVRDLPRLTLAMRGVDVVVHAAALKIVPALEYNPFEAIQTNVLGAQNVVTAALANGVQRVLALSTDKATQPINLYGATKLCAEKLFAAAGAYVDAKRPTRFACLRYGNVSGSRGSVIPFWRDLLARGQRLPITDPDATRFWITLPEAVACIRDALNAMEGGELFVPKLPAYRIGDLAAAVAGAESLPDGLGLFIGLRPGEKMHEWLIGADEERFVDDAGPFYIMRHGTLGHFRFPDVRTHYTSDSKATPQLSVAALRERLAGVP